MRMRPAQVLRPGDVLQYVVTAAVLKKMLPEKISSHENIFPQQQNNYFFTLN